MFCEDPSGCVEAALEGAHCRQGGLVAGTSCHLQEKRCSHLGQDDGQEEGWVRKRVNPFHRAGRESLARQHPAGQPAKQVTG